MSTAANAPSKPISAKERDELLRLIRARERVAKTAAAAQSAELLAEFEKQIATKHAFNTNEVWAAAKAAAEAAVKKANDEVQAECARLGVPEPFRPSLQEPYWYGRGENAVAARRAELRRVAVKHIEALEKQARTVIERRSVEAQSELLAGGLSGSALAFLDKLPSVQELMPAISLADIEASASKRNVGYLE